MSLFLLCLLLRPVIAFPVDSFGSQAIFVHDRQSEKPGWYDPRERGGQFLDYTTKKYGEPLNVIISGHSDPFILSDTGLHSYAKSLGYSEECLGLHYGHIHQANLGDGDGRKSEAFLARQHYFPVWGTCWESIAGGHHFRAWKQNGTQADSGAWFIGYEIVCNEKILFPTSKISASKELDSSRRHIISPDGYNIGRDRFVERAVLGGSWKGMWWKAHVEWRTDLIKEGKKGVNHGIAQDGRIAVLTVVRL